MMRLRVAFLIRCVAATVVLVGCDGTPTAPGDAFELTLAPSAVPAGAASQGTVTLRGRSSHDFRVQLSSSDAVASVPASLVIPAGSASAAFMVFTRLVAADTVAKISAAAGTTRQDASLQVLSP